MELPDDVDASKAIQQRTGPTFHLATRCFPERMRHPTYVLYAFFRVADEVVDDPGERSPAAQRAELRRIRDSVLGERETDDPVLEATQTLIESDDLPHAEVETFLEAMAKDIDTDHYDTYDALETYLRGSSVAVGYLILEVMAARTEMSQEALERARHHARALAEAFQLTNFLRDVSEDIDEYDRVYLPGNTLAQFGVSRAQLEAGRFDNSVAAAVRTELRRTERLYRQGVKGIEYLPEGCQFAVLAAAVLYAEHHRLIRDRGYDTLTGRPTLTTGRRVWLIARTWVQWRRTRDPVETFYAVSSVVRDEDARHDHLALNGRGRPVLDRWSPGPRLNAICSWLAGALTRVPTLSIER